MPIAASRRAALAAAAARPLGCTQVSEILASEGVTLAGPFELATMYSAAVADACAQPALVDLLAGPQSAALRAQGGFENASAA